MIRVLIVEDSPVDQELLVHILDADPELEVIAVVRSGEKALSMVQQLQPDLITMDIHMPGMNGYETTRSIMENNPVPIIIVSGYFSSRDSDKIFRALDAGALAIIKKPHGPGHPDYPTEAKELIRTVKTMSEVKVVRRRPQTTKAQATSVHTPMVKRSTSAIQLVVMGASTGGPAVFRQILSSLPKDFAVPIIAVQHMTLGFMEGFVKWLAQTTGFPIHLAGHGDLLQPGHVYFAPDDRHLLVSKNHRLQLAGTSAENGMRPSVSILFRSVAETVGPHAAAVLLTGMGKDGAEELKLLKRIGALTLIQDQGSSVVYGMPGEALKIDAADLVLPPDKIAVLLSQLVAQN
ncbi:MAG: chemotaxis protein CheB [Desulfuromonadaceae bacterium]